MKICILTLVILCLLSCQSKNDQKQSKAISRDDQNAKLDAIYNDNWKSEATFFTFQRYMIYYKGKAIGTKASDGIWYGQIKGDIFVQRGKFLKFACKEVIIKKRQDGNIDFKFLGKH